MGYREVTMLEVKEVLRRWLEGAGKKTIAAQLALDVKTVRRCLRAAEECGLGPGAARSATSSSTSPGTRRTVGRPARAVRPSARGCARGRSPSRGP